MRLFLMTAIMLLSGQALAAEPDTCRNGAFPSYPEISYGEVSVSAGQPAAVFPDGEGGPDSSSCSQKDALKKGDKVLIAHASDRWSCVWYSGKHSEVVGWIASQNIRALPERDTAMKNWLGNWKSIGGVARIVIRQSENGQLTVTGTARWVGGPGPTGERIIHFGDLSGTARPAGHQLRIGDPEAAYTCVASFRLLHDQLVVSDNGLCGGANVRFDAVYRKQH